MFVYRKVDADAADCSENDARIDGPAEKSGDVKGDVDQKFQQRHEHAQQNEPAANGVQCTASYIKKQRCNRNNNGGNAAGYWECEAEKPASCCNQIHV